jgi:hypothetical protein
MAVSADEVASSISTQCYLLPLHKGRTTKESIFLIVVVLVEVVASSTTKAFNGSISHSRSHTSNDCGTLA